MALEEKLEYQMTQEGYDKLVEELEHYSHFFWHCTD